MTPSTPRERARVTVGDPSPAEAPPLPPPLSPYAELLINLAPTGPTLTSEVTPHVPLSPGEVIEQACRGLELGASIVHLHARDAAGRPTYRAHVYEEMILGIRGHFPLAVIGVSCIGNDFPDLDRRSEVLELTGQARPDLASLAPTTFDLPGGTNLNTPETVLALAARMTERGIRPELECFDSGMIAAANALIREGRLEPSFYFNLLLGGRTTCPATARHLSGMVADLPAGAVWAAAGIGLYQLPMNLLALAMGGHCRTGLEDNPYAGFDRNVLATNESLIQRIVELAELFGRPLASHAKAREMLGLGPSPATLMGSLAR